MIPHESMQANHIHAISLMYNCHGIVKSMEHTTLELYFNLLFLNPCSVSIV